MGTYKHLLFDLDETLFDFHKTERIAFDMLMKQYSITNSPELYTHYYHINQSLWKALERKEVTKEELKATRFNTLWDKAKEMGLPVPSTRPDSVAMNRDYMAAFTPLGFYLPGAEEFLQTLVANKPADMDIHLITNGTAVTAHGRINASGIDKYATGIYISDEIGVNKPDVKFFEHVIKDIGDEDLSNYLVIGDSLTSDIKGANNIGIDACLFYIGERPDGADKYTIKYEASSYEDLIRIILS